MGVFIYSNTLAIIEFDIHETIFIFWQSKYILQKYYFGGGQKFMHVSYNELSLALGGAIYTAILSIVMIKAHKI